MYERCDFMYYPVPMHMHSCWESEASMAGHFYHANKLGIKHMYFTDHDSRMGRKKFHIDTFDFSKRQLFINEPSSDPLRPKSYGFTVEEADEGCDAYFTDNNELCLSAKSSSDQWSTIRLKFSASQKRHEAALLAGIILHLGMKVPDVDEDIRVCVDVKLSRRPPDFEFAHVLYVFGNSESMENKYTSVKNMSVGDGEYILDILKDAQKVGGGDNVLRNISFSVSVRKGKSAQLLLSNLLITREKQFEEGRREQQKLATEIGKEYGVTPYVITEITEAGPHKNCFSTKVPIIDYEAMNYEVSEEYAINHVMSHGGIFGFNHPFERFKNLITLNPELKEKNDEIIKNVAENFITNNAFGASLIEVGFPEGRSNFSLEDHLELWDKLSEAGIFITGYGDSDNHSNIHKWYDGNNFAGYIFADNPCEEEFVKAMKGGNLYTGDPVHLQNVEISFEDEYKNPMGSVVFTDKTAKVNLSVNGGNGEMKVVWKVNGITVKEENFIDKYVGFAEVLTEKKINFVRAEIYKDERCIMLTNPIYYTSDKKVFGNAREERRRKID